MRGTEPIYNILVNRVPGIQERYRKKRNCAKGIQRGGVWLYLLGLNISYYVFRNRKLEQQEKYPYYEEKLLYSKGSESSLSCKLPPEGVVEQLAGYDVISFDVFDTLILRPFSEPTDLFFLLADQFSYPDLKRIRQEMEWKAREKKYKSRKHYETTLDEIYNILSEETGLDKDTVMQAEVELENKFCFANPYMKNVVSLLKRQGKRIVITSDMYLNTGQIRELLQRCGYPKFDAYYVSCGKGASKSKGDLYELVRQEEGQEKTFAHVGDNYISDVQNSEKHGFCSFHYVNVNAAGEPYRPCDMSSITGSVYRGIVNAHIHNGMNCYTREYEYGYLYGGLFVAGYCQFIHGYVQTHHTDKILFLARDGDVLSKAYQILYPEEEGRWEYVYWSRLAATKMSARYFKYDYFRRFLYHKVNQGYSMKKILQAMELEDMLGQLCGEAGVVEEAVLTDRNVEKVKSFLMGHWKEVLQHYEEQLEAGKQYYSRVLDGYKAVAAVDIGWAGSGAVTLNHIVNEIWHLNCEIAGIIAGTNTCHNAEPDATETFLQSGKITSYLYSQRENRDLWKFHNPGKDHNLYWEMLLDAPMGSLKGFYLDEAGKCECRFREVTADVKKVKEIQNGILDFVRQWKEVSGKLGRLGKISGRDAYAPMVSVCNEENKSFMKDLCQLMDDVNVG